MLYITDVCHKPVKKFLYLETSIIVNTVDTGADRFLVLGSSGELGRRVIYTRNTSAYLVDNPQSWVNGKNKLGSTLLYYLLFQIENLENWIRCIFHQPIQSTLIINPPCPAKLS